MLHLDRDHLSATLSPSLILQNSHSDQNQILSWSAISRDSGHKDIPAAVQDLETSPASTLTPPPEQPSPDDRIPIADSTKVDNASRQSTPLSDLSSPSNHEDSPKPEKGSGGQEAEDAANTEGSAFGERVLEGVKARSTGVNSHPTKLAQDALRSELPPSKENTSRSTEDFSTTLSASNTSAQKLSASAADRNSQFALSIPTPPSATSPTGSLASNKLDTKVVTILELNAELLKAAIEFQNRGIPMSDARFSQFSVRMQSNLAWMAAAADANRESMNMTLPVMQPPDSVEFLSMARVFQLYATLPTIFANDVARRNQSGGSPNGVAARSVTPSTSLKRDRTDEMSLDLGNKRRDMGENKILSAPSAPLMSNQAPFPPIAPSISPPTTMQPVQQPTLYPMSPPSQIPAMPPPAPDQNRLNSGMRFATPNQQQVPPPNLRQTSPPSTLQLDRQTYGDSSGPAANGNATQHAGLNTLGPMAVQYYNLLKNPSHPMVQFLINSVPGFQSLPVQTQISKLHQMQTALQSRGQQQMAAQRIGQQAASMTQQNNQFPNPNANMIPTNPSPTSHQSPMSIQSQSFGAGSNPSIDPRIGAQTMTSHQQTNVPNLNNLSAPQRQMLMMQQQMRVNGMNNGAVHPSVLNSQIAVAQERMRHDQHRMSPGAGSSHSQSPMGGSGMDGSQYPVMRSNSTVPGIARSGRSPTDGSPMQAQMSSGSQPSPEDIQRAMYAQQQRNMMGQNGSLGYVNHQQVFPGGGSNWQQQPQPHQQQQQQQSGGGMGVQQQQGYRMSPPPSAGGQGGGGYGGPPANVQQWGQGGGGNMQYPFNPAPLSAGDRSSATPTPSQQMSHNATGSMDPSSLAEFDLFNQWGQ